MRFTSASLLRCRFLLVSYYPPTQLCKAVCDRGLTSSSVEGPNVQRQPTFPDFTILRDERELIWILQRLGPQLTGNQVVAAFGRLRELKQPPETSTLLDLAAQALEVIPRMSAHEIVSLLNSCVRLRFRHEALLQRIFSRLLERKIRIQWNGALVASTLSALGLLQEDSPLMLRPPRSKVESLQPMQFELIQEFAKLVLSDGFMEKLKVQDLVSVVSGFGMLRFQSPSLQQAIILELSNPGKLKMMKYEELVYVWKGLAFLQINDRSLIDLVSEEISQKERLNNFSPRELDLLLSSTKLMSSRPWKFILSLMNEISKPERLSTFTETQLASIIQDLPLLSFKKESIMDQLIEEVTKKHRLAFFTKSELSGIACSLKKLGFGDHEGMKILIPRIERIFLDSGLLEEQILSFLFAPRASKLEETVCDNLIDQLLVPEILTKLSDLTLSGFLNGLYERQLNDPERLTPCIEEILQRLNSASTDILSYYAYGLRINKVQDSTVLQAFAQEVIKEENLKAFDASQLAGIVYSLGMLRLEDVEIFRRLFQELCHIHQLSEVSERGLANIITILHQAGLPLEEKPVQILLKEVVEKARLLKYSERSLMSMINSFGRLRITQRFLACPLFDEATKLGRLSRLSGQELSELVYNSAQMRTRNKKGMENLKKEIMKPNRLSQLSSSQLASVVYGLGANRMIDRDFNKVISHHIVSTVEVEKLKNPDLGNMIRGLAGIQCQEKECLEKLFSEGLRKDRLESMMPSELTSLAHGMGQLRIKKPQFVGILTQHVGQEKLLENLSNRQLTQVIVALLILDNNIELSLPKTILKELAKDHRISQFESYQLAEIASVLPKKLQGEVGKKLVELISEEVRNSYRLENLSRTDLSVISRSLSESGYGEDSTLKLISDELMERFLRTKNEDNLTLSV